MHTTDLPPDADFDHVRKVLSTGTERLLGDLPRLATASGIAHPFTGAFSDEAGAIRYLEDLIPRVVQAYLAGLDGNCEVLEQLTASARFDGRRTAHAATSDADSMVSGTLEVRQTLLHGLADELDELDPDVHDAVCRGLLAVSDRVLAGALSGYFDALPEVHGPELDRPEGERDRDVERHHLLPNRREHLHGLLHDIRSPLALITGWAETLVSNGDRIDSSTSRKALRSMQRAARQVTGLSENLIDIDLVESGEHRFVASTFAVAGHVKCLVGDRCGVSVRFDGCDVPSHDDVLAYCDPSALDRALQNLVDNALAHGVPPVDITISGTEDIVNVDVTDAGQVDPDFIASAFRGRVSSTTGFGIGLRTTRLLLEAVGGRLRLTSMEPTTFRIELPRDAFGRS